MTTPNMTLELPVEGPAGSVDVWGGLLNDIFDLIDAHDHTTGKGVPIPAAALNINADVSWSSGGSNFSITDMKAVDFTPVAPSSVTSYASALFVSSADNNLYLRNQSGTNVKITDGSTLNVSIVGGIGGDYSSIGALFSYDDATDTYLARQETAASVRQYAKLAVGDIKLFEYIAAGGATVPTNAVTIKSPSALAASYTATMPAAVPTSTRSLWMTSAGVIEAGRSTTLLRHISPASAIQATGSTTRNNAGGINLTGTDNVYYPIETKPDEVITGYTLYLVKGSNSGVSVSTRLYQYNAATDAITALGIGAFNAGNAPLATTIPEVLASPVTVGGAGFSYYLIVDGGSASDLLGTLDIASKPA